MKKYLVYLWKKFSSALYEFSLFFKRLFLKNKNFTIITNNCIGGFIYKNLKSQFLSPTIGLFFSDDDFVKFALNLKHYLNESLIFFNNKEKTPVAMLDDIIIHFNHYETIDSARDSWNRRISRINFNNLYLIFTTNDVGKYMKLDFSIYKNYVFLTNNFNNSDKHVVTIKIDNLDHWWYYKLSGKRRCEKYFDYIKFLNYGI